MAPGGFGPCWKSGNCNREKGLVCPFDHVDDEDFDVNKEIEKHRKLAQQAAAILQGGIDREKNDSRKRRITAPSNRTGSRVQKSYDTRNKQSRSRTR